MILAIDVGNTRIKYAVIEQNKFVEMSYFVENDLQKKIENILEKFKNISVLVVSSVGNLGKESFLQFQNQIEICFIDRDNKFPFENLYKTPATLGIDRMVLSAGAVLCYPNKNRLVIDAGTCITYDFVDSDNNYIGGAISPGIRLRYESMHHYTSKLPLLSKTEDVQLIGSSTIESMHSGVVNGVSVEIDGFINVYKERYSDLLIILTGGDAEFLAKRLKNTIFANPNFLLESLYQTYQYNHND